MLRTNNFTNEKLTSILSHEVRHLYKSFQDIFGDNLKKYDLTRNENLRTKKKLIISHLLYKFSDYKTIEEISDDFRQLKKNWLAKYKGKADEVICKSFELMLTLMESHFVTCFIATSREALSPAVLVKEKSVDIEAITKKIINTYKHKLMENLAKQCDFKVDNYLKKAIIDFNIQGEKIINYKLTVDGVTTEQMAKLYQEELVLKNHRLQFNTLKNKRVTLSKKIATNKEAIIKLTDELLNNLPEIIRVSLPKINVGDWQEFDFYKDMLEQIQIALSNIRRVCLTSSEQLLAIKQLKQSLNNFKLELNQFHKNVTEKTTRQFMDVMNASYFKLKKLDLLMVTKETFNHMQQENSKLLKENENIEAQCLKYEKELTHKVKQILTEDVVLSMSVDFINARRDKLQAALAYDELAAPAEVFLIQREKSLHDAWERFFLMPDALTICDNFLRNKRSQYSDPSELLIQQNIYNRLHTHKPSIFIRIFQKITNLSRWIKDKFNALFSCHTHDESGNAKGKIIEMDPSTRLLSSTAVLPFPVVKHAAIPNSSFLKHKPNDLGKLSTENTIVSSYVPKRVKRY